MLETILDRHIIFVLMGILTAVGIMSKCIANVTLKRLIRAAGNMNKSNHPLMRLVRAKFEHVSMISDKVENVRVFVDKYLYEYKVLGVRLHGWRRTEKAAAGLCLLAGAAGAGLEYSVNGMNSAVWKNGAIGGGLAAFIFLVHLMTDEKYQMEAVRNYMVDYLENVCRHKYEKTNQKEIKILAQEGTAADFTSLPTDSQENTSEYVRESKESAELFEERVKGSGEEAYAAEVYATRKREPMKGQSAVSAFLAAELKAEEFKTEELEAGEIASAFRAVETGQGNEENIVELPKLKPELKLRAEPRLKSEPEPRLKSEPEPRLKSEPEPKLKPEPVREALAAAVSDSAEYDGQARSSIQRQNISKDKKPRRERPAEDTDRDVVIRRILEEFMA